MNRLPSYIYIYIFKVRHKLTLISLILCFDMREIVHIQAGQCGNQIGAKVSEITGFLY